ncbi:MAG: site-specific DNA-methyltransferase [Oscillospiraceae bacterium]|nr:site-specific DNA-methyltransferase [Oscillospiraceae bacterium]MBQ9046171.1 site-specific DNA-methyltransferase [Oscillospiraceae bacterium]
MNIRKAEIERFLTEGLPEKVHDTLAPFAQGDQDEIKARMAQIEQALGDVSAIPDAVPMKAEYLQLQKQLAEGTDLAALETDVYSALYSFFNRYYEEGDFISKRRYKEGVYAIPYEGEEVKLYWANQDQYYIKTSENFKDYTFLVGDYTVHFRLVDATTEQNNNKEQADSKRVFMLFTEDEENYPGIRTFEYNDETKELIIRFVFDIPEDKKRKYFDENYAAIRSFVFDNHLPMWQELLAPIATGKGKETTDLLQKHLKGYVAKNTFDYFIHKDLRGFLSRELDFYIKSEIMHLDDLDTGNEARVETYLAKIRAVKRVGKIIIDFLAQIEDFQKKLWLKKKFVVETNWCMTLDRVDESFWQEIIENRAQIEEWIAMYAIDEVEPAIGVEGWTDPPSMEFLRQNQNLLIDTKHFSDDFKMRLVATIDHLDEQTSGLMIDSDNYQALKLLYDKYYKWFNNVHIDPPYNTDTSGFLYKNNYRHSSWASMMLDRLILADQMLEDEEGSLQCHIDENEYELLFNIFSQIPRQNAGTIIWDKLNPMLGRKGVATQHEYVVFRSNFDKSIYARNDNIDRIFAYEEAAIAHHNGINEESRKEFASMLNKDEKLSGGDRAYHFIDDDGNVFRLVAMGAPEKRTDPKYFIPLIHPVTGKPCPVPSNGWSRKPETMEQMIKDETIVFGKDESTQPQKKVILSRAGERQISSVLENGKSGKADLDKLGFDFPYAHPVSLYETLISANHGTHILDFFAGSGTTGHAAINLTRGDGKSRKYCLVEMGEYFDKVTRPRMQKVVYAADWKDGKPQNRNTGVSQIIKYMRLESYEDALSNISLNDDVSHGMVSLFDEEYLIHYMLDLESRDSLLDMEAFCEPFSYQMKITEKNECKTRPVDLVETFNYLIGLTVVRQGAASYFAAKPSEEAAYEGAVDLVKDFGGEYAFRQIEGTLPDGKRALVIWRTVTDDVLKSNAALDAYFTKYRINPADREYDVIFVNGDSNLENLRTANESWKVQMTEIEFKRRMFEEA